MKPYEQSLYMQYAGLRPGHSSMVMAGFFVVLRPISDGQYPTINIRHPAVILRNTQAVSRKEEEEEALREYRNTQEETRMGLDLMFLFNSILLGMGLAMDAFSVSLANGLNEPGMKKAKMCEIAGVFAVFQAVMPLTGWFLVHTIARYFRIFERFIPWIAFLLLGFIGGKMLCEGIQNKEMEEEGRGVGFWALIIQGIATSIDALSAGFTIAGYDFLKAFVAAVIIAAVTFVICICGLEIGKRFGVGLSDKAQVLGGAILIVIGLEIFVAGVC